jgi:uroporphyrinogen-III synthase
MMPTLLVTRPDAQAAELVDLLRDRGVRSVTVLTVSIDGSSGVAGLDRMLTGLEGAAWIVLTSANGVEALASRIAATGQAIPADTRVAAVGPATADALRAAGIRVDHVPAAYLTVEIARGLGDVRGRRIVLARADAATPDLRLALIARGADVEEVVAYRTLEGPPASRDPLRVALHGDVHGITFTSSSTVRGLLRLASAVDRGRARALPAFCIGPITAGTARRSGFHVAAVAAEHTAPGLAATIAGHFDRGDR